MIETKRLLLVPMAAPHLEALTAMNADPKVMAHFPEPLSPADSEAMLGRFTSHWAKHNFGYCAVVRGDTGAFIGFTGLAYVGYETHFTPCVEIGWRFNRAAWGHGYAFEAALACLEWGFNTVGLSEIVSFTTPGNTRSIALMQRLGMEHHEREDFQHPSLALDHPLSWHVLYRLLKP